jgi:hypothetical protein
MKASLPQIVRAVRLMVQGYAGGSAGYVEALARTIYQDEAPSLARLNAAIADIRRSCDSLPSVDPVLRVVRQTVVSAELEDGL